MPSSKVYLPSEDAVGQSVPLQATSDITAALCSDYAGRLLRATPECDEIRQLRTQAGDKFRALCLVQLSFLIDVPLDLFHDAGEDGRNSSTPSALKRMFLRPRIAPEGISSPVLTAELATRLQHLICELASNDGYMSEGIFRKTGNLLHRRQICEFILHSDSNLDAFDWPSFSPHELAGALKVCIAQLASSLLTEKLMPLFFQAKDLWSSTAKTREVCGDENQLPRVGHTDSSLEQVAFGKQLKSFRLLTQLLPDSNRQVLKCLLHLLRQVLENEKCTRMTASALGTIFGPVFSPCMFDPSKSSMTPLTAETACRERCQEAIQLATRLIELNDEIFLLPTSLVDDIYKNLNVEDPVKLLITPRGKRIVSSDKVIHTVPVVNDQSDSRSPVLKKPWSPCLITLCGSGSHCRRTQEESENRSPPLHTSIRFATPFSPYDKRTAIGETDTTSSKLQPTTPISPSSAGAQTDSDSRSEKRSKKEPLVTASRVEQKLDRSRLGVLREVS
ncbi:Rho GTPase-activating protein 19 [Sparganum proliferum]